LHISYPISHPSTSHCYPVIGMYKTGADPGFQVRGAY